jgi:TonB family protein
MSELLQGVLGAGVWLTVAVMLLAVLRPLLLKLGGAGVMYRAWWLVPMVLLAPWLPSSSVPLYESAPVLAWSSALKAPALPVGHPVWLSLLGGMWLLGVMVAVAVHVRAQHRFVRAMGTLRRRADGAWQASGDPGLPALVGLWHPRIVVGPDFDQRFSMAERDLVLQHERSHRQHGDHWANAALAAVRCVFWFHPLLPWASRRFLVDQELACDARTVDPHPALRRLYANALLKAQLAHTAAPMACHWRSQPMLKERIAMLNQRKRKALSWMSGQVLVVGLCAGLGTVAWASEGGKSSPAIGFEVEHGDAASGQVAAQVIDTTAPVYPTAAFEQGLSGKVELRVDIGVDGRVTDVTVLSATPPGVFEAAALGAARQWTFSPALRDGKAVASALKVPVTFAMNDEAPAP